MENEFKLGPLQTAWIKALRDNPDKQGYGRLGYTDKDGEMKYCCLGMARVVLSKSLGIPDKFTHDDETEHILCDRGNTGFLSQSYQEFSLVNGSGGFTNGSQRTFFDDKGGTVETSSLLGMNDNFVPWSVIADFIEENPTTVFLESK